MPPKSPAKRVTKSQRTKKDKKEPYRDMASDRGRLEHQFEEIYNAAWSISRLAQEALGDISGYFERLQPVELKSTDSDKCDQEMDKLVENILSMGAPEQQHYTEEELAGLLEEYSK